MNRIYPDLQGKVAVVTGGSRGIGAATAYALAMSGAKVLVNGRDSAAIDATVKGIAAAGGTADGFAADSTDFAAVEAMRGHTESTLGPVEILAVFAGGGIAPPGPIERLTEEEWHSSVDGNLTATFLVLKSFLPGMKERRSGSIITMASTAGRQASQAPAPYAAAKAGIVMLTRHVAAETGPYGVRVNCVSPSAVRTERTARHMSPEAQEQVAALHPLRRLGTPEDVADATLFLASDASSWLTGLTIDVAGGRVMS
ncbi:MULTISPECIES: SDR family NAD(P)-dependent oxidoreductase [Microtetraspora]|uniref:SDR family NAD(P)-dependent oxidoreductase n=1 Tax=Microtetraspora glauca TaxID=1996 RepID=A0ABV3G7U6_MICGL|nr:SDR family NAD(P)-dependent oxidoreductase [Microtetraspora sp. AC03309]MCC5574750.1 SDR family oxidoreductase [Microtetraspora sp. AC03309]